MAENLSVVISVEDQASAALQSIATVGQSAAQNMASAGDAACASFEGIQSAASVAQSAIAGTTSAIQSSFGGVQVMVEDTRGAIENAAGAMESFAGNGDALGGTTEAFNTAGAAANAYAETVTGAADSAAASADSYTASAESAAGAMDHWTAAAGNYDHGLLEAIYTTEELVEAGYKTSDALTDLNEMFGLCEQAANQCSMSMEAQPGIYKELESAIKEAETAYGNLSEAQQAAMAESGAYEAALASAQAALEAQATGLETAQAAMENYDAVMMSGTEDLATLEAAAESAMHAGEDLAAANGAASDAAANLAAAVSNVPPVLDETVSSTQGVTESLGDLGESAEEATQTSIQGFSELESLLAGAGIVVGLQEITSGLYDMTEAAEQAKSVVQLATGATGSNLESLNNDMLQTFGSARHADLMSTAEGIGEVNTRMGLTGAELSKTTGKFIDFANVTGGDVKAGVASVTQIMNKWGLESSELDNILDQLVYTGQATGVSVENLTSNLISGQAAFSQMGIGVEGAISLLGAMELQGVNSSSVLMGLRTAVKGFSEDGVEASAGLEQAITAIQNAGTAAEATSIAVETFGSRAGVELASAVRSGAVTLETLKGNLDSAHGSLERTADASLTMGQKWEQSQNRMKMAWTTATAPMFEQFMSWITNLVNGIATFAEEHQILVSVITGAAIGFGAFLAVLAAYKLAMTIATVVTTAFGAAVNTALGPIALVVGIITGLVAITTALANGLDEETRKYNEATPAAKAYGDAVKTAEAKLRDMEASGRATTEELEAQRGAVEAARSEYEAMYQTMEEYAAHVDEVVASNRELIQSLDEGVAEVNTNAATANKYVDRLASIGKQNTKSAASTKLMENALSELNAIYPDLNLSMEDFNGNAEEAARHTREQIEVFRQQAEIESYAESISALTAEEVRLQDELAEAGTNLAAARYQLRNASVWDWGKANKGVEEAQAHYDSLSERLGATQAALESMQTAAETAGNLLEAAGQKAFEAMSPMDQGELVAATVIDEWSGEILSLCEAYDQAYQSAYESMTGQFGLFEDARQATADLASSTAADFQKALNSQLEYWTQVEANTQKVSQMTAESLGVSQAAFDAAMPQIMASDQAIAAIANAAPGEAAQIIESFAQIDTKMQETASAKADVMTGFSEQLGQMQEAMGAQTDQILADLDQLTTQGSVKGGELISNITNAINSAGPGMKAAAFQNAHAASQDIINEFQNASTMVANKASEITQAIVEIPSSKTITFNLVTKGSPPDLSSYSGTSVTYNAKGTRFSTDNVYIAGEEGPELIVGGYGSTVYTADETRAIFDALSSRRAVDVAATGSLRAIETPVVDAPADMAAPERKSVPERSERTVNINLNGHGIIRSDGSVSKSEVVNILQENLKPVLIGIVQEEFYEEGQGAYVH